MKNWKTLAIGTGLLGAVILGSFLLLILGGCQSAPTAFERKFFDVRTNYAPVLAVQTNVVPVTLYKTNEVTVPVTNEIGVTVLKTNVTVIPVTEYQTNLAMVTNQVIAGYTLTPGAGAEVVKTAGGAAAAPFGVGGLVTTALTGIFGLWGYFRSQKNYQTGAVLAQNIETIRAFIQQLPNGTAYDEALTAWLAKNQASENVVQQVLTLLQKEVSNPDAQVAAQQVLDGLKALNPNLAPTTVKTA